LELEVMPQMRILLLSAALLSALRLDAGTLLFSNLVQPGNQYGPDGLGIGHTPAFPNPGDYLSVGVEFTPSVSAQLTMIEAPFGVISGTNQIQAFLMSDSGGTPDAVIESFVLSSLPTGPGPYPLSTINSALDPLLLAGQPYWFVATGGPNAFASWSLTLFQGDPTEGGASQTVVGGIAQLWDVGSGTRTGALEVFGDAVPEPSAGALAGCALLLLGIRRSLWKTAVPCAHRSGARRG
jgi:hypothetical protein